VLFIFYTAFFTFTVMNIMTGMIVEHALKMSQSDDETLMLVYRQQQAMLADEIRRLFRQIDVENTGNITLEQFQAAMEDEAVEALMDSIDLACSDATWFFKMLMEVEHKEDGAVDIDHFTEAVMKLKGAASSLDLQIVSYEVRIIRRSLQSLCTQLDIETTKGGTRSRLFR